ncbi:RHS repeat domain-containing protein [Crossiella cryophila]|uniref:RHS repeat-associated protein n=1 Tax=Crossiella cryophila TaxID=43355 RepID=A0A7W7CKF2_9PSEU|nr:RHS repeat-associated core domain-containing protein [Crossiella cryophila]MBB4681436.1 RHS repeat-associated protein [Crossiella cryophila]
MRHNRSRRAITIGLVAALSLSLVVATASTASAAGGPSVELPEVPSVPVTLVRQGSRGNEKDEAGQSARRGDQAKLPAAQRGDGDYSATALSQSGKGEVAGQTGDFNWSYQLKVPPAAGELMPSLGLGYNSGAVDGLTSASNNQASWVGDGWSLWPGSVERTYGGCQVDLPGNPRDNPLDLCWKSHNATLSLNGTNTALIRDDTTGGWKPKSDNGMRVELIARAEHRNGDNDGEHWRVTTTDGTQYFFGVRIESAATWTVPVYGDDDGEPCYRRDGFAGSWCDQAYRWNLDKVVSPNGDVMVYNYGTELNKYGQNKNTRTADYVRGGWLKSIEYGLREDMPGLAAGGRVEFEVAERCVPGSKCDPKVEANRANFPDVPLDLRCEGPKCDKTWAPSFWTTKRLAKIRTEVRDGAGYRPVDSWTLRHEFPYPKDLGKPALWLAGITHTGHDGGELALPEVSFEGVLKPNRVVKPNDGYSFLNRFRIGAIVSESGAVTSVTYAAPDCTEHTVLTPETNTLRCFPVKWTVPDTWEPRNDYFHKYVVSTVSTSDWIGSEVGSRTDYEYSGGAAWHYDESEFTADKDKTWNQFRGYGKVIVRTGATSEDARKRTKVATTYYRGMHGDKGKPSVKVTDSEGGSVDDHNWLSGIARETTTYLGDTAEVVSKVINEPFWREKPTARRGEHEARIVRDGVIRTFTTLAGNGKQETKTQSFYEDTDPTALVSKVHDFGEVAKAEDDRCVTTKYQRDTAKWLMDRATEVDTIAVACDATARFPEHAISNDRSTYDDRGNVIATQALKSRTAVDKFEHITTSTVKRRDEHGRALEVADALGKVTTTEFTPRVGGPVTQTRTVNPLGFPVTTTVNPATGATLKVSDVDDRTVHSAYDPLGRLTQVWLPGREPAGDNGNKKFSYKISRTQPNVVTTETLGPNGTYLTTKEILDGQLRPRQTQRPTEEGRLLTDIRYDSHGRAFQQSQPFFNGQDVDDQLWMASNSEATPPHTVTEFDGAGRATAEIFKAPQEKWRSTITYGGNWTKVTPPAGGVPTTTLTDARGQVIERRTDAPGPSHDATTYRYTAAGQLSEVKDPENNVWQNEYDLLGRLVVQHDPDKGVTRRTYDNAHRLIETRDARGVVLRTSYDDLGRTTRKEEVRPDRVIKHAEWTYDTVPGGKGLAATSTRWIGNSAYTDSVVSYDLAGRPASTEMVLPESETGIAGRYLTTVKYNDNGSVKSTGIPAVPGVLGAETVTHTFDDFGRLKSTYGGPEGKDDVKYVSDTIYTKYGEQQQLWLGEAGKHSWVSTYYEPDTRRANRTVVDTETAKPMQADVNYTYNPAGLITAMVDQALDKTPDVQCFGYDHLQRLTSAWTPAKTAQPCAAAPSTGNLAGPAPYWQSFTYDKVGGRLTDTQHAAAGNTVRNYAKGGGHRMKSVSAVKPGLAAAAVDEPVYDAVGNTVARKAPSGAGQKLDWDVEGRLVKVTEGDKATEFVYGVSGDRLIRRDPSGTTVYLAGQELHVKGMAKTVTRYYSHGGRMVATRSGDRLDYLATDHHGTVNTSIDSATLKTEQRRQLPFGGARGPQGNFAGDKGFVGGTVDSSAGFTTLGRRQYDADTGRFLSVDPIGDYLDPQQLHGYAYSNNSPISMSDPSGLAVALDDNGCPLATGCGSQKQKQQQSPKPDKQSSARDLLRIPTEKQRTPHAIVHMQLPAGASDEHMKRWARLYQARVAVNMECSNDALERSSMWCVDAIKAEAAADSLYKKLLASEQRKTMDDLKAEVERIWREGKFRDDADGGFTVSACASAEAYVGGGVGGEVCVARDYHGWGWSATLKAGMAPKVGYGGGISIKINEGTIEGLGGSGTWYKVDRVEFGRSDEGDLSASVDVIDAFRGVEAVPMGVGVEHGWSGRAGPGNIEEVRRREKSHQYFPRYGA